MKKINFKQPKYVIPTLVYIVSLVIPYLFMEVFDLEIEDKKDANLQTTEYLNAQLPSANVSKDIGSKRKNMRDAFGEITDRSAVQDFTENQDTVNKKEDFESKYSEEELRLLDAQAQEQARIKNLQDLNNRIAQSAKKGESMSSDDYVVPMTDEERAKALAMRRQGMMAELDRDLNNIRAQGAAAIGAVADAQDSIISKGAKAARDVADEAPNAVRELDDDAQKFGQASRMRCPDYRYDAAKKVLVERTTDPSAREFSPEQRKAIELAADCGGFYLRPKGRDFFYEVLFSNSEKAMGNIPDAWKADVKAELRGLARGEVRDVSVGLHR